MSRDPRTWLSRKTIGKDLTAGLVLGVESVPDGLASGVLAGVNPLAGLYGYLYGMVGAAFFTSSTFMAVQATGAMALVVGDANLSALEDPDRGLFTLAVLTGISMIVAGLLRLGRLMRFVPSAVMTGFITAVGINIVLGQLANLTDYSAEGANRIIKTFAVLIHLPQWDLQTVVVGIVTIALITWLQATRLKSLGLVLAVVLGSALAYALNTWAGGNISVLSSIVDVPSGLPAPVLPDLDYVAYLALPAVSLAFVGLVQGAGVSSGVPNPDGKPADMSQDFIGQGVGNIVAGLFRGMPVGGSMSASALIVAAGARTRLSLIVAGGVMALVIIFASNLVAYAAMPALAGLLIVVGIGSIKPSRVYSVFKAGPLQSVIMLVTLILTLIIPLQYAVLVGVGLGLVLFVAQQSNRVRVRQVHLTDDGRMRESDPPDQIPANSIVVLQPYGSLFFASAPNVESQLPHVSQASRGSVVIIRLRGTDQVGLALVDVLRRYYADLDAVGSSLKIVLSEERVLRQAEAGGLAADIGESNLYQGTEWVGDALRRAYDDARHEVDAKS